MAPAGIWFFVILWAVLSLIVIAVWRFTPLGYERKRR